MDSTDLRTAIALLQQSHAHTTGMLQAVRDELREVRAEMAVVTRLQEQQKTHDASIDEVFEAIKELSDATKVGFEESRKTHFRDIERVRGDHDKSRTWIARVSGIAVGVSLMASTCVGLVMYYTNKADQYAERERLELQKRVDANTAAIREMGSRAVYYPEPSR